jgi:hypothetical protein
MPFQPDILITTPHGIAVVVDAMVSLPDLECTEEELKRYMFGMQCPVGLLITPDRLWLYRDFFTAYSPESVQRVGEFDAGRLWSQPPPTDPVRFETFVQLWIESLGQEQPRETPKDLRDALQEHVLPALTDGDVRAAHPRYV